MKSTPGFGPLLANSRMLQVLFSVVANLLIAPRTGRAQVPCFPGEIKLFAGDRIPFPWLAADGSLLSNQRYPRLYRTLGTRFGGDGTATFAVPDLSSSAPLKHTQYLICADEVSFGAIDATFVSEIALFAGTELPSAWQAAQGQILDISRDLPLFSLIGDAFGGDGETTFALPNLADQSPVSGVNYVIAVVGQWPTKRIPSYLGETTLLPTKTFPESEMVLAAGQLFRINREVALFSVIGLSFGGDGREDFALPDLTDATPARGMDYLITYRGEYPATEEEVNRSAVPPPRTFAR
jgi:microcystin-dependent protein